MDKKRRRPGQNRPVAIIALSPFSTRSPAQATTHKKTHNITLSNKLSVICGWIYWAQYFRNYFLSEFA
jgi:hypothetical protein